MAVRKAEVGARFLDPLANLGSPGMAALENL
jgi:hypothetical protein